MAILRNQNAAVMDGIIENTLNEPWRQNLNRTTIELTAPRGSDWWTGCAPIDCPGYSNGKLYALPIVNLATCTREQVRDYFNNGWTLTEVIFSSLIGEEAFYRPPYHGLRHPFIFYYGHPAVLYVQKLRLAGLIESGINPYFEQVFEIGVDEMSWDDMSKNDMQWPTIDEVLEYRKRVYNCVLNIINEHPDLANGHRTILQEHPLWALFMGFEHERIHLETSSVLIREFPINLVARPAEWPHNAPMKTGLISSMPVAGRDFCENSLVKIEACDAEYGKPTNWPTYGWDNEYGSHKQALGEFSVSSQLISNGEYWQFVLEGGYSRPEFWTETGWKWRSFRDVKHPTFWIEKGSGAHEFELRLCFEIVEMQWNWPVVVNFHEAKAFCKWKSQLDEKDYRLPTEAEHQAMRLTCGLPNNSKESLIAPAPFNSNLRFGSESDVAIAELGGKNIYDVYGNVWQWSEDHFHPLNGFKIHPYYADFSTPCYDGEHQMIMGGSFVSVGDEATPWARFHFRPHFFQQAGFRIVHSSLGSDGGVALIK